MFKVLLIETDIVWQQKIISIQHAIEYPIEFSVASKINEVVHYFSENTPSLIITDLFLEEESVSTLLASLNKCKTPIIYIPSYCTDADWEANNIKENVLFLVKPFHKFTLISFIHNLIKKEFKRVNDYININGKQNEKLKLPISKILLLEQDKHYCKIVTDEYTYTVKKSLLKIKETLNADFLQTNRKSIINLNAINRVEPNYVIDINGKKIKVTYTFRKQFNFTYGLFKSNQKWSS